MQHGRREQQRGEFPEVQRRGGFSRQFLWRHETLGNELGIAKLLPGPQPNRVQHIDAGLRRPAGGKERHAAAIRGSPPGCHVSILAVFGVQDQGTLVPGQQRRNNHAGAFPWEPISSRRRDPIAIG